MGLDVHPEQEAGSAILAPQAGRCFFGALPAEAGPGDFVFGPMGVPHTFLVTSERAETLITFSPAGTEGPAGFGVDGFFRAVAVPVVPGEAPPELAEADPQEFARRMAQYGIEVVGPPPTLEIRPLGRRYSSIRVSGRPLSRRRSSGFPVRPAGRGIDRRETRSGGGR